MKLEGRTYYTKIIAALSALGVVYQAAGFEPADLRAALHVHIELL